MSHAHFRALLPNGPNTNKKAGPQVRRVMQVLKTLYPPDGKVSDDVSTEVVRGRVNDELSADSTNREKAAPSSDASTARWAAVGAFGFRSAVRTIRIAERAECILTNSCRLLRVEPIDAHCGEDAMSKPNNQGFKLPPALELERIINLQDAEEVSSLSVRFLEAASRGQACRVEPAPSWHAAARRADAPQVSLDRETPPGPEAAGGASLCWSRSNANERRAQNREFCRWPDRVSRKPPCKSRAYRPPEKSHQAGRTAPKERY